MHRLPQIVLLLLWGLSLQAQSPHGPDFLVNCSDCHSSASWEIQVDTLFFNHDTTAFPLAGQHQFVDCRACHETLVFDEAPGQCIDCHTDIHRMTVGNDCARCHTPENWLVDNITELHQENGFPLLGAHAAISCADCHTSATTLEFNRIGNDCINCHLDDFNATTNPNHQDAGFPTDCATCHRPDGLDWGAENIDHNFFPLTKGHDITDCTQCHTTGDYSTTIAECVSCHLNDFENTLEPRHEAAGFSNDCIQCHTTDVGWMPAVFADHDALHFPIYSGSHQGEWMKCAECHDNSNDYASFTCTNCHINPETDDDHDDVGGYVYEDNACLACHPTGDEDSNFDHNESGFPLTGAHLTTDCIQCHANGYAGTATECAGCHTTEFNATTNPDHSALGLSTDCASCHSTQPGWSPAAFADHDSYYALNGAHAAVANDCAQCHNGDYNNTPNTCAGCHTPDFNQTSDPDHEAAQFPTDCATCHSENAWVPSSFDHNNYYPLDGAHQIIEDDCVACHNGDYANTPNTCAGCHAQDYSATVNPDHEALGLSTDCASCHSTQPDWAPAAFADHDNYYALNGAHAAIANDCVLCHNGDYNNTPNTCFGCHSDDYNNTDGPNHATAQFPTDCTACHSEDSWVPSTLDHDAQYFPIYSGAHQGEWSECIECHTNPADYTSFTCTSCHTNPETNDDHEGVGGYVYENTACLACHPTGDADNVFDHDMTAFPLNGAHLAANCLDCHASGYAGTATECAGCHTTEFNAATNPDHSALGLSTDCASCHSTQPGWSPAAFADHDSYYALNGAHAAIANDCAQCHNGDYNNTPNTCAGCHTPDFNQTSDPDHEAAQFPTDCATCHSENAWVPSSFDHNNYYPLDGAHQIIEDDCVACHNGDYANTPNTCAGCHAQDYSATVNPDHEALGLSTDCASCHSTQPDWAPAAFADHDNYYALNGAHAAIANDCVLCHNGDYNNTPNTCFGCHSDDYNNTDGPNHATAQFPTDCTACHSEDSWVPSTLDHDAQYFPIYSGAHQGEWSECIECHTNPADYTSFTCTSCHTNPETNDDHEGVGGYVYENTACLACHPTGDADNVFDHDMTAFPLNGAHLAANCLDCHASGYAGTATECAGCHTTEFNATTNPDHSALGLSTDCASCHSTQPGWSPAAFADHDSYYALNGAHAAVANDCAQCHNGDYNNTPNTCAGCHTDDFNQASDPDHEAAQFPTDCATCHSENAWVPSSFDHNNYYPLDGAHQIIEDDCVACHNGDYANTPNTCAGCHAQDYSATVNPDHEALGLSTDCASCHSTQPDWAPAAFADHDNYYALNGTHAAIANDCVLCHNGDYNNTPNTCFGCHSDDYNNTENPNHATAQFAIDCQECHTEDGWVPSTLDHDGQYFPIFSGAHEGEWSTCMECHTNASNFAEFSCTSCHTNPETNDEHAGVGGYAYESNACLACHPTGDADNVFDHNSTAFPLTGAHLSVTCQECHTDSYAGTPTACAACHTNDYAQTINPSHQALGFATECTTCHTTEPGWSPATFADHDSYYALNGAHAAIANDCAQCHNGDYNNTPNTCFGCHINDYNQAADPNHAGAQFPTDCATCHSENAWVPSNFNHDNYYPLTGGHQIIADDCNACHQGDYTNTPNTCAGCHTQDYAATVNPDHQVLGLSTDCESCHTTTPGWSPATFADHNSYYALNGAHAAIANDCILCHNGDYNTTPNTCFGCHINDYNQAADPNHAAAQFPTDCQQCHTENAWVPSSFNHDSFYPLTGGHQIIANDCNACHQGDYTNTPNTCAGCHTQDYAATVNPDHQVLGLSTDCESCHTTTPDWSPATFADHDSYYALNGAHAALANDCAQCHNGDYNNTPNTCFGCHTNDYNSTSNPNHTAAQFPIDCEQCHSETTWVPSSFNHDSYYPLTGAHANIATDCNACHMGDYNNTPNTCFGCHTNDYNSTSNPNHTAAQFPIDCEQCHSETTWVPSSFNHDSYYPLTGAHANIATDCNACHMGDYNNTPNTCFGCHSDDYNSTSNPNHAAANFSTDCTQCHSETSWAPSSFNHDQHFPLTGAHAGIATDCNACHMGDYNNTPNTCFGCHSDDYNSTSNPNHAAAQIATECQDCHNETTWVPATFDHNNFYPIEGAHQAFENDCNACHMGNYTNTPNTCDGCHLDDYNSTSTPNHATGQLPLTCEDCHSQTAWVPSTFDHDQHFPLTGAHQLIENECFECHQGNYNNTPNTCEACHNDDYNQSTNPNHLALGIPMDCASCHTTDPDWIPASFDIHNQYYALNGAHAAIANDCAQCHNGDYNNTPNTCFGCHNDDYNGTSNPNHATANFPTDCEQCHSETTWIPSSFNHDSYYPLTGAHAAIATDCNACHMGDYNNTPNTCFGCHSDDYNSTSNPNHAVAQIATECQDCHNETAWIPSFFNHDNYYPLTGAHAGIANDCNACHMGDYNNTPNTCFGCHSDDYNGTSNPNHAAANFPTDCEACHSQNTWIPSTFDHDAMYFPIYSGKHEDEWNACSECHTTPNNYAIFDCINCHNNAADLADDHDEVPGYMFENNACFACHPTGEE